MFERFDDGARRAAVQAQQEAVLAGHEAIGTEHLMLGVLTQAGSAGAGVLEGLGITSAAVRARLAEGGPPGRPPVRGKVPFRPDTKKALQRALREALRAGDNYVGTEHLLLGVLADRDGPSWVLLRRLGAEPATVLERVRQLPRKSAGPEPGAVRPPADVAAMRRLHRIEEGWRRLRARIGALLARARHPRR